MLLSVCLIHVYSFPTDSPRNHFSSWRHLGTLSTSMWKQLKLYIWRLHPLLPNGFKRHPEYSSFLFLWVPGQLDSDVKHCCKLRNGTGRIPIYLCFKASLLYSPSSNSAALIIFWIQGIVSAPLRQNCLCIPKDFDMSGLRLLISNKCAYTVHSPELPSWRS